MKNILNIIGILILVGCSNQKITEKEGKDIVLSPLAEKVLSQIRLKNKINQKDIQITEDGLYEKIIFKPPLFISDAYTYEIKIDSKKNKYWLLISGGIAGIRKETGPFNIK
jgi:hypothetical protein